MGSYILNLFISGFYFPGISIHNLATGIGLGLIFGAIWYAAYFTPVLGKWSSWAVMSISAFLTWALVCFIQVPLQSLTTNVMNFIWSQDILMRWILLAIIPQIIYSGLIQEGSKLVPVLFMWRKIKPPIDPKTGLVLGAVAGLGFGIFEAVWIHNSLFASGWDITSSISTTGIIYGLLPFWERFFTVAFHTASSAIAGWGLFRGRGWQFYLISSLAHAVLNYSVVLYTAGHINQLHVSIYVAVISLIITAAALWLRYRKDYKNKNF
jgi:RsiW-degrading membrane proteinase PrsW (M82 family)